MEPTAAKHPSTKRVLLTSFFVDVLDVVMNVVVAVVTGSVVMLSEALEGLADLTSVALLLFGYKRSQHHATRLHPFGFGKEMYFWSTLAAFVMIAITATLSFSYGYREFQNPSPIHHLPIAYIVLVIAVLSNGYSFLLSARKLLEGKPASVLFAEFMASPLIAPKTTLVLDAMGTCAAIFGLISLILYGLTGNAQFDGIGAMIVGLTLAIFSVVLLVSIRSLITGQSAPRIMERRIRDAVRDVPEVNHIVGMRTMIMGSNKLLVNIDVHLRDGLTTDQVESVVEKIKTVAENIEEGLTVHVEPDPEHHMR